ncbi:transposase [Aneurinibacillus migulanus]|uniref:transposase n=1 Tax=Aneurinibacillus migulanus TaxID=47500 RepID=UPI0039960D85
MFLKFSPLKRRLWDSHLWNSSFYIETVGSISEDVIRKYIENQKKGDSPCYEHISSVLSQPKNNGKKINETLMYCRWLYNALLEQRITTYKY